MFRTCFPFAALCWLLVAPAAAPADEAQLKRLVEQIIKGEGDAQRAADQLVDEVVRPLADAIAAADERSPEEKRRLRLVLGRVLGALRVQLFRAELPEDDRKLVDRFIAQDRELVEKLFDDDEDVRLRALRRIPLEPNSAAGLLIVSQVMNFGEVGDAACALALELKDPVTKRALARLVERQTRDLVGGAFGRGEEVYLLAISDVLNRVIVLLGEMGAADATPVIVEALRQLDKPALRDAFRVGDIARALGKLGDERAAPMLLDLVERRAVYQNKASGGRLLTLTDGDAALLALAQIYRIEPKALGFVVDDDGFAGFADDDARLAARRQFRDWHTDNAEKPAERRTPFAAPAPPEKP